MKRFVAAALPLLLLAACDMSTPSQVNVRQVQLREAVKTRTFDAFRLDSDQIEIVAGDYARSARGPMSLTLAYTDGSAASKAAIRKQGAMFARAFMQDGVSAVNVAYVGADAAYAGKTVVAYKALTAQPPKDCGRIPGYQGADPLNNDTENYGIGCETAAAMSKMAADPSDFMGKAGVPEDDSRRDGTLVEKYRAGTPNPKLNGLNASTIGASSGGGGG